MERQTQELGIGNANGRLALYLRKEKGHSLIHKTENLFEIIYDNFDCELFVEDSECYFNVPRLRFAKCI